MMESSPVLWKVTLLHDAGQEYDMTWIVMAGDECAARHMIADNSSPFGTIEIEKLIVVAERCYHLP